MAEKQHWDRLVMDSPNGNVYSLSWYLDVVAPGKWAIMTNEKMDAGFPLAFKKRAGYRNIYQPFYTMFFNAMGNIDLDEAVEAIKQSYHHIHFTTESLPGKLPHRLRQRQELSLQDFTPSVYSENASRQIKKAEKNGLVFSFHDQAEEVVQLFKENKGGELKEYKQNHFETLGNLIAASQEKNHGFCAHVKSGGMVLASAFFLSFRNRIIFLKGGVNEEGKNKGAMYYLMHHVLEWSKDKYEIFDFGGSNNKNVAEFYRRLGGKDAVYYEIEIDRRNILHKIAGKLRK